MLKSNTLPTEDEYINKINSVSDFFQLKETVRNLIDDVKKQFDIYKAKMESLLISQLELLKDVNKED